LLEERHIQIKISGCMNSCGQHIAAPIGLHGSSIKYGERVAPAMQIVLGGGVDPDGTGYMADKIIKLPTKRIPEALRYLLDDYEDHAQDGEYFNAYYRRQGERYFYSLLKPLAEREGLLDGDFQDWGDEHFFQPEIGVGECAGVSYDKIGAIIGDAVDKIGLSDEAFQGQAWSDSIYHSYSAFVIGAKALLLSKDVACNSQHQIIESFEEHWVATKAFALESSFAELALQINKEEPSEAFAKRYLAQARAFVRQVQDVRETQLSSEKEVLSHYYKA
jgi:sulfite reductase (ferredoxin)